MTTLTGVSADMAVHTAPDKSRVWDQLYDRLRRLAGLYFKREQRGHTMQPTALVHEAYLRLAHSDSLADCEPGALCAVAARTMRRVLVDHARRYSGSRRGRRRERVTLQADRLPSNQRGEFILELHDALERLAAFDPKQAWIVELRYFAGMSIEEIAGVMGVSTRTINRSWLLAKGWLYREMTRDS
ncbi:MAG: sigma-70 family RNA polymerase sigma factor [Phycisphaerales bacterium]|nr:sigma-70 family RNA polymerase sigma factor [Phycisphaerales bacterium]MCB9864758.1 sigma-70 family RNA polymerase sigma factor [Phycisphaerales bacterium]